MAETRTGEPKRRQEIPFTEIKKQKITRRRFMQRLAGAALVLATTGIAVNEESKSKARLSVQSPELKPPEPVEPVSLPDPEKVRGEQLNIILKLRLDDSKRKELELGFAKNASSLSDIDLGLYCLVDPNARIALLEKRYNLRKENTAHKPLSEQQSRWADKEGIHPETLAIALEAREIALKILRKILKDKGIRAFRQDIAKKIDLGELGPETLENLSNNPELMLLSAGGMARLIVTESGYGLPRESGILGRAIDKIIGSRDWIMYGFANIGKKPAVMMTIDQEEFPKKANDQAITYLAKDLSKATGLEFYPENIPGSERDANSLTGGALGIQIMPSRAKSMLEAYRLYVEDGDPLLHPLNPIGSAVMAYLFLAQGAVVKDGYQPGYIKGPLLEKDRDISQVFNTEAVKTWNPNARQAFEIIKSDVTYINDLLGGKINAGWRLISRKPDPFKDKPVAFGGYDKIAQLYNQNEDSGIPLAA